MEFTLNEIRNMLNPLTKLSSCDLPIRTTWRLFKFSKEVVNLNDGIEKMRIDLVKKYGTEVFEVLTKDDQQIVITKEEFEANKKNIKKYSESRLQVIGQESLDAFAEEFNTLLNTKESIEVEPFTLNDFGNKAELSVNDLIALQKILA